MLGCAQLMADPTAHDGAPTTAGDPAALVPETVPADTKVAAVGADGGDDTAPATRTG